MNFKLRLVPILIVVLALNVVTESAVAQQPKWMGYWANNSIPENHDHTNMTIIWANFWNQSDATNHIVQQLDIADSYGVKAIVMLDPYLFNRVNDPGAHNCPFTYKSDAQTQFGNLVSLLINEGHLVPNNPSASTIAAFSPVDEPDYCSLNDVSGAAHPALAHAVNVIRSNSNTSNFPVFMNMARTYQTTVKGMQLVDWVGMDNYSQGTGYYLGSMMHLASLLLPAQKIVLVPQAAYVNGDSNVHDPAHIFDRFVEDSRVIGIIPFLWDHNDFTGLKDIPALKAEYQNYGGQIKAESSMSLSLWCTPRASMGPYVSRCTTSVSGGTSPYSYSWSANCSGTSSSAFCNCPQYPGDEPLVDVVVADSNGFYRTMTELPVCGAGGINSVGEEGFEDGSSEDVGLDD